MKVREYLKEYTLLFDGGMGTYYSQRNHSPGTGCELASISQPELIEEIHREYLEAGCRALKTNTFGANRISFQGDEELVRKTVHAAWEAAAKAAADYDAFVFADIGPISSPSGETEVFEEYRFVADCFLEQGAENFLFETNANTDGLKEITMYIREKAPEAFIIVSFAVQADGFSRDGILAADLLADMRAHGRADALGLNCICGARHMLNLVRELDHEGMTLALMPNAGYPTVIGNRTFYDGDPRYFAEQMREMAAEGAMILGGCCGTAPVHIEMTAQALAGRGQETAVHRAKIRRELNMDALPHMTCRDRNLNATKALLLGLYAEGIRNVLLVTGDPIPSAERDEVKSVYQFNSRKLAAFAASLGKQVLPGSFHLFGALNVNARNFDVQLKLAKEKEEKGMIGFLTQPVLTEEAFENLKRAKEELSGYILGGVIPVVSARNARFMDSEINGINVDPKITELYEGKTRAESEDLAVEISVEIMKRISGFTDGYYLMTPFGRTGLIVRIMKEFGVTDQK